MSKIKILGQKLDDNFTLKKWNSYKWQKKHIVRDINKLEELLGVKINTSREVMAAFKMAIPPHYLSLIDVNNINKCPVFKQAVATDSEIFISISEKIDPLAEKNMNTPDSIVHRYPDRVLFLVTNVCSMYCRFCTRKRIVGNQKATINKSELLKGISYIRDHKEIRDVLISGGDPLYLKDADIDWILAEVGKISHIEIIRIGTRIPVVIPQRVTKKLIKILKKHSPIWVNTHFNHSVEINRFSSKAILRLVNAGIPINNQSVLLKGVNSTPKEFIELCHKLLAIKIRPYYLYQGDLVSGTSHLRASVEDGLKIMEKMIGHTTGFARPFFVIDAPNGGGKIPINPKTCDVENGKVTLINYEGIKYNYEDKR